MGFRYGIAKAVEVYDDATTKGILRSVRPWWTPRFRNGDVTVFFRFKETRFIEAPSHLVRPYSDRLVTTHAP